MNKVDRATKLLDRVQQHTGMSDDGKKWLIEVLDPMHDKKLDLVGYPDREVAPSIVQLVKQTQTLAFPASVLTGAQTWGFHVMIDDNVVPTGTNNETMQAGVNYLSYQASPTKAFPTGGMNVVAFDSASTLPVWQIDSAFPTQSTYLGGLALDPDYLKGKTRIVASAVEIVNTTAELYKGGSALHYELPESKSEHSAFLTNVAHNFALDDAINKYGEENIWFDPAYEEIVEQEKENKLKQTNKTVTIYHPAKYYVKSNGKRIDLPDAIRSCLGTRSFTIKNLPPNNVAEAMLLPGTQQWSAKDGTYMVQTMSDMNNPPSFVDTRGSIYTPDEQLCPTTSIPNAGQTIFTDPPVYFTSATESAIDVAAFKTAKTVPFHRKGAIYTGLTKESTFTLNYHVAIERFISSQDKDLVVLACPSPGEDPIATQLYTLIVRDMPVAVQFKDNGLGDWFLGVVDEVANVVSTIGKPIMSAVTGYQNSRRGENEPSQQTQPFQPPKVKKAGKIKKNGQVVEGPRLPNQQFKSQQAKTIKAIERTKKNAPKQQL